ncbi:MAG TPA: hypothetical protein VEC56_03365 [Candidatus Krumholzibacteria bacterium]|nr:hypothetical protein [Candidatus Krumholzibacteria bacterium]
MEFLRVAKRIGIRALAALMVIGGALAIALIRALKALANPTDLLARLRRRALLWPWLTQSYKQVIGMVAYNAFVFFLVEPILRRWFPPLKPWEHVTGIFSGGTRTTYEEIVPTVATALWIAGNALVIVFLRDAERKGSHAGTGAHTTL